MVEVLPFLFFFIALVYASIGFGGGSSYTALLALAGLPYLAIPQISLVCNIIVVSGSIIHFHRERHLRWGLLWPFIAGSVPFAYIGGLIPLKREIFFILLGLCLLLTGLSLVISNRNVLDRIPLLPFSRLRALSLGGIIGLISGMVGIGGGIFLAPALLHLRWTKPKEAAAVASGFIFLNSAAGLSGQLVKASGVIPLQNYWPLFLAVFLGGQMGSLLCSQILPQKTVRNLTALLVIAIGARLVFRSTL